jgi:hypothetical protein
VRPLAKKRKESHLGGRHEESSSKEESRKENFKEEVVDLTI